MIAGVHHMVVEQGPGGPFEWTKKAAGTLTDKETQQLERLEKQAARGDRPAGGKRPKKGEANNQ